MRYAILSDVHANLQACDAVLAEIAAIKVDRIVCLGDVVGYGPRPAEVLARIRGVCPEIVMGNHDAAVAGVLDAECFTEDARRGIEWTAVQLDAEARACLGGLPYAFVHETRQGDVMFVHASASAPEDFPYVETEEDARQCWQATEARVVFVGHTHHPRVDLLEPSGAHRAMFPSHCTLRPGCRYIVNVGSAGMARDADFRACWCVFDDATGRVIYRRTAFDVQAFKHDVQSRTHFMEQSRILLSRMGKTDGPQGPPPVDFLPATGRSRRSIPVGTSRKVIRVPRAAEPVAAKAAPSRSPPAQASRKPRRRGLAGTMGAVATVFAVAVAGWALVASRPRPQAAVPPFIHVREAAAEGSAAAPSPASPADAQSAPMGRAAPPASGALAEAPPADLAPIVQPRRGRFEFEARRFSDAKFFYEVPPEGVELGGEVHSAKDVGPGTISVVWVAGEHPGQSEPTQEDITRGLAGYAVYRVRFAHPGTYRVELSARVVGELKRMGEGGKAGDNNSIWVGRKDAGPESAEFSLLTIPEGNTARSYTLDWKSTDLIWKVEPGDLDRDLRFTLGWHKDGIVFDRIAFVRTRP